MILLVSILSGFLASSLHGYLRGRRLAPPKIRFYWLAILAFLPQFFSFYLPVFPMQTPDLTVAVLLVSSQVLLTVFVWLNRRTPGMQILGFGLILNLVVIVSNGGLMPISPETVQVIVPYAPAGSWQIGERLGWGKDIVLPKVETRLWILSDTLLFPIWFPYQVAFSFGDVFIAIGAFWMMWSMSRGTSHV